MSKPTFRVCLAQINTTVGDVRGNFNKVAQTLNRARLKNASLVTFPELTLTGYPPEDLLFKRSFIDENIRALRSLTSLSKGLSAVIGFADRDRQGRLYNAAAFLHDGRLAGVYRKAELPNYGVFDEKRYFHAGKNLFCVEYGRVRVAVTICEDIWMKTGMFYKSGFFGAASLVLNISASPFNAGKQKTRLNLVRGLARSAKAPVIYQNLVGGQDELVFDGGSLIVDASGRVLAEARRFEEDVLFADLPLREAARRVPAACKRVRLKSIQSCPAGFVSLPSSPRALSVEAEIYEALVLGTRDYIQKNGFKKALVGLSGGIDSALVACIAVDAVGPDNVMGVTMPSPYTSSGTLSDAKKVAANLAMRCVELSIEPIFKAYRNVLAAVCEGPSGPMEENLQARIRGNLLMALSNRYGQLVLTTGNKSEMATGYCTLYGDMAGGFAVIKDVPKTMVYRLARWRNQRAPVGAIPESTIRRAPTAELKPNQKDQDTLPPYPQVDRFLELYVERDAPLADIFRGGVPKAAALRLAAMVDRNEYKRRQSPPGIKITPRAFGRDRRMPITNRYQPHS